jgi:nuclear GTP-binding protein
MPKGKNHQSKRTALHTKYKIQKKVREHHRKERKEQKNKLKKQSSLEYRKSKDPGVPNAWPFKEQLLQEVEGWKDMQQKERLQLALQRKRERERARKAGMTPAQQIAELKRNAAKAQGEFEMQEEEVEVASRSGRADVENTKRAYYRELHKIVNTADVILVVLDARDPLGCRPLEVERYIMNIDPSKRIVLVLNKIDLVPKENVTAWVKYLRRELPTVAIKCSTQEQKLNLGRSKASGMAAGGDQSQVSQCIGGEQLLQLLKNYSRNSDMKVSVTVGVVGYPNVGKSSLINSLARTRAVETGAQAGVTKKAQQVQLDKKVKLLDCPGIVFAKDETDVSVILRNCVKLDAVIDPLPAFQEIVRRCDKLKLMTLYKTARFGTDQEFLQLVARARGKMKRGGVLDLEMAARTVLQDWVQGKIPYCTKPPVVAESIHDETSIVATWGKEFDLSTINQVAVIDEACVQLDEAFMALQGLSIGSSSAADMAFAEPEEDASMETDEGGGRVPARKAGAALKIASDAVNARVTKASKASRAEAAAAAVRKQDDVADEGSDYDFDEAFAGEQGKFGALRDARREDEESDEGQEEEEEGKMED